MRENVLKINKVFQQYFLTQKILPILTIEELDSCNYLRDIFLENGIKVFEITLRTKVALEAINVKGLVPAGEGAGYAGGILSAGIDGIRAAEALAIQILGTKPRPH